MLPDEEEDIVEVREDESPEFLKSGSHAKRSLLLFLMDKISENKFKLYICIKYILLQSITQPIKMLSVMGQHKEGRVQSLKRTRI